MKKTMLILAVTTTGLNAGLLYAYEVSVIPAFASLSNSDYIASMQAINVAIQNAVFIPIYMLAPVFLAIAAFQSRKLSGRSRLLVAATLLYVIGTLGITFAVNIPLNDTLANFALHSSTPAQAAAARAAFEGPWNVWHLLRTLAAIGALVLSVAACLSGNSAEKSTANQVMQPMQSQQPMQRQPA